VTNQGCKITHFTYLSCP